MNEPKGEQAFIPGARMGINNKQFLLNQIIWIGISLAISIAISIILPFPVSFVVILGVFILLSIYIRTIMMKRGAEGTSGSGFGSSKLNYHCMNCGHNIVMQPALNAVQR